VVLVADVFVGLQLGERGLVPCDVVEKPNLPELVADDAVERVVQQIEEERIDSR
jgi:hypothetical protein